MWGPAGPLRGCRAEMMHGAVERGGLFTYALIPAFARVSKHGPQQLHHRALE